MPVEFITASLECGFVTDDYKILSGVIDESLGVPTSAEIRLVSANELSPTDVLEAPTTLFLHIGDVTRSFHLVVTAITELGALNNCYTYVLQFSHVLALRSHTEDCRIFQELTATEIVKKVLQSGGLDARFEVSRPLATRVYTVQYGESDLQFIYRLLEDEGLILRIEHGDDAKIVIADDSTVAEPIDGEAELALVGGDSRGESVLNISVDHSLVSESIELIDYDEERPKIEIRVSAKLTDGPNSGLVEWPGGLRSTGVDDSIAKIRAQELAADRLVAEGESNCFRLTPFRTFDLKDAETDRYETTWFLRSVCHSFSLAGESVELGSMYRNHFTASAATSNYRPARVTPRPTPAGSHMASVTVPSGQEVHVDKLGRLKLQFGWDRVGKKDEKSSRWVRQLQPLLGDSVLLARKDFEVMVRYIDGDLNHPVVVGHLYDGTRIPPYALPANKTMTNFGTISTPNGEQRNELRFEDKAGSQELYFHAGKDWEERVFNDKTETIGGQESVEIGTTSHLRIGGEQRYTVKKNRSETIGGGFRLVVDTNLVESVGESETVHVVKSERTVVVGDDSEKVDGNRSLTVEEDIHNSIEGNLTESTGGNASIKSAKSIAIYVGGDLTEQVGGDWVVSVGKVASEEVGGDRTIDAASLTRKASKNLVISVDGTSKLSVQATALLKAADALQISAKEIKIKIASSGSFVAAGATVSLSPASAAVVGMVTLQASASVEIAGAIQPLT